MDAKKEWVRARNRLVEEVTLAGFPEELGQAMARQLGSPAAMERMRAYIALAHPATAEEMVDEMLGICSEIASWRRVKDSRMANARYQEIRRRWNDTEGS